MRVLLLIALRNLTGARRRTALLSTAIGLVTMLLVLLLSLSSGIEDNLVDAATTMSGGHVNVGGFYKASAGAAAPVITDVPRIREIVAANTPGLDYVVDRNRGWGKLVSPTGAIQVGISGIDVAEEERFFDHLQVVSGDPKQLALPQSALLFENQAERLEIGVGDVLTIQTETLGGRTNTIDVTVVAIAQDVGLLSSFSIFTPKSTVYELYRLPEDSSGAVWVYLHDIDDAEAAMKHLRGVFAAEGYAVMDHVSAPFWMKFETVMGEDWTGQKLDLTTWRDEVSMLTWVITAFDTVTWFLVAILVAIIAVGIMNTMWNAVRERTREVGTMRAIGMRRGRVAVLFLLEALLLGLFATTAGALLGSVVAIALDAADLIVPVDAVAAILLSDRLNLSVHLGDVLSAVAVLTALTGLSALWPAIRASRLQPITALGHAD